MTWVPYVSGKSQAVISNTIIGGVVESHIPTANAAFGGDNQSQVTDDRIFQLSTFQGLVPGEQYVILAVVDAEAEDLLAADNVLY
ncbi:hypothetical protein, partial [Fusobacterium ulcerans]|uniref:hypothetical protein n=1 Tax=Fusobacterium ulcerans TaxID=861 RepID=UPI002E761E62